MKTLRGIAVVFCVIALMLSACGNDDDDGNGNENAIIIDDNDGADYNPVIDSANFVNTIDNPYFTLTPGTVWIYEGTNEDGETEGIQVEVTQDTKTQSLKRFAFLRALVTLWLIGFSIKESLFELCGRKI